MYVRIYSQTWLVLTISVVFNTVDKVGSKQGVLTIQEYVLNQVLTIRVGICT